MAWGHRLKRLTKREKDLCRSIDWVGCAGCGGNVQYLSNYSYASAGGHAAHARRPMCTRHARQFAMRHGLAWPARPTRVPIRIERRAA
jgi:hypothetical protein